MSTAITDGYDNLISRIQALLPNHKRLPNPYKLEENPELFLRQGYGLAIGPGENTNRELCNRLSIRRTFSVSICRRYAARDEDASAKATTEKQIMEDLRTIVGDFETNTTLTNQMRIVKFESDSGINYVQSETDRFMFTEGIFTVEYFETL